MALSEEQMQLLRDSLNNVDEVPGGPPFVRVERSRGPYRGVHLVVVWDAWEEIPHAERSRIITDAYEAIHGVPTGLEVKLAMGLTQAEAKRQNMAPTTEPMPPAQDASRIPPS